MDFERSTPRVLRAPRVTPNRNTALAGLIVSLVAAAVCIAWVIFTAVAASSGATTH